MSLLGAKDKPDAKPEKKDKEKRKEKDKEKAQEKEKAPVSTSAENSDDPLVREMIRSGQWKEQKDEKTGRVYYFNPKTKQTTWDLKKELRKASKDSPKPETQASPSPAAATDASPPAAQLPPTIDTNPNPPHAAPTSDVQKVVEVRSAPPAASLPLPTAVQSPPSNVAMEAVPQSPERDSMAGVGVRPSVEAFRGTMNAADAEFASATSAASALRPSGTYEDPVQRLMRENSVLQQLLASGSRGQIAVDFQAKYDALVRTNTALTLEINRMKVEYDAMARALTDANKRIHELQLTLSVHGISASEKTKDEEMRCTMAHLREQNRILITHVSELSTLLARGLAERSSQPSFDAARNPQGEAESAAIITRFLDSSARSVLCPNCALALTRHRDRALLPTESNVGNAPPHRTRMDDATAPFPLYEPVADLVAPPPTHYYTAAAPQPLNANAPAISPLAGGFGAPYAVAPPDNVQRGHRTESPAVMYGGFVIRNPRVPQ